MICPQCRNELPEGSKFCNECGRKLEVGCPECGKSNPPGSKFCLECGQDLRSAPAAAPPKELSFDEKLAKIQKYLPSGLTEKVLSQRDRIEGEKRQVTIMFVDMKGFTPLTEKLGPEETFSLMDQVFEILIQKVHDYEGTVNELRGDGMLAFFGAPIALEDSPQRAIRSSLAIHREMTRFNDKIKADEQIPPVQLRIGINAGPVVIGTVGNDLRVQFTAVGDTINMAARMEQMAEPGTTYVTEDTFKLTEGFFRFEALGEKQVKGKDEPLKVYRVIAPSSRRTRFDVAAERGLTRFVGRERQLGIILDAFERAKGGSGQAISIVGEAGVGKSRLLYEFRKAVANEDVTFLEGKCLSYSTGVAYHPFIDVLKSNFGTEDGDGDVKIIEKVRTGLTFLRADESATLPYLLELLSVEASGMEKLSMSPEAKKDRIVGALWRTILKGSEIRPLILAFEDLHWMDKSSEEAAKYLLESIPGARVLMVFTYRPEFVHTWGARSYHSQVTVNRFSNRESLAMVNHLLGSDDIDNHLGGVLVQKTEGIPFFIEEFVRSLRDLNIIQRTNNSYCLAKGVDQVAIPSTIQDVIMARVDSLPDAAKRVLQAGAVIEREFSHDLIKAVTGMSQEELLTDLSVLKDAEPLYERGIYPESTCIFKHALTREVVYHSILTSRKKKLHEEIGNAIKMLYKHNIHEYYGILAEHYFKAENWEKSAEYSTLAGKKAIKTASMNDAIKHTMQAVGSLERLPQTVDVEKKIIAARTVLGQHYLQMNYHVEAKQAVDPIFESAMNHDYRRWLSQIFSVIGAHKSWIEEDFTEAFRHLEKAQIIAKQEQNLLSLLIANLWMGSALVWACEFEKASHSFEQALQINLAANNLWGVSVFKSLLSLLVYYFRGDVHLAYETSRDSMSIAEQSADMYSTSIAFVIGGICCYGKRFLDDAIKHLSQGINLSQRLVLITYSALAAFFAGEIYFEMARYQDARHYYDSAVVFLEGSKQLPSFHNLHKIGSAMAKVMINDGDIDLESLYVYVSENKMPIWEGWMRRYLGEILMNIDDQHTADAQHWIEEAIAADDRNGMRFHLGRDYALYGELFKRKGDTFQSKEQLGKAIEIYKECGADGWVTKAEEDLAKLQ